MKIEDYTHEEKQNALDEAWEVMNPEIETNAERLDRIAETWNMTKEVANIHPTFIADIQFLFEQAERARKFEERLIERGHYTKRLKVRLETIEELAETRLAKNRRTKREQRSIIDENKRLREAFENARKQAGEDGACKADEDIPDDDKEEAYRLGAEDMLNDFTDFYRRQLGVSE